MNHPKKVNICLDSPRLSVTYHACVSQIAAKSVKLNMHCMPFVNDAQSRCTGYPAGLTFHCTQRVSLTPSGTKATSRLTIQSNPIQSATQNRQRPCLHTQAEQADGKEHRYGVFWSFPTRNKVQTWLSMDNIKERTVSLTSDMMGSRLTLRTPADEAREGWPVSAARWPGLCCDVVARASLRCRWRLSASAHPGCQPQYNNLATYRSKQP